MNEMLAPRSDVASASGLETIAAATAVVSPDMAPWIDGTTEINTRIVTSPNGVFQLGSIVGANEKLAGVARTEMQGGQAEDDRLNTIMYNGIQEIMRGNPGGLKRMRNAPSGSSVFYGGTRGGARVFFMDGGNDAEGTRTFFKVAVGRSKNVEPKILGIISGNGRGKEKV